jgi:sRNA-binding regulator protein Hfq
MSNAPTTTTPATATDKKQGNGQRPDRPPKLPNKWGVSEAKWMADQENELITVHMRGGETLRGYLIGLDQFTIFVEHETTKAKLLIAKHAIDYIEPGTP